MSTSQQPPMSRREARLAAQQAAASSLESLVEPGSDTPARPAAPSSAAAALDDHAGSTPAPSAPLPPSAPAPAEGRFRARDFRPPAERERAVTSPPSFAAVQPDDQPLEYRTAQRTSSASAPVPPAAASPVVPSAPWLPQSSPSAAAPSAASAPAPSAAAPDAPVWMPVLPEIPPTPSAAADPQPVAHEVPRDEQPPAGTPVEERTMSRRELRARRAAAGGTTDAAAAPAAAPVPEIAPEAEAAPAPDTEAPVAAAPVSSAVAAPPLALVDPPVVLPGDSAAPAPSTATGSHWSVGAPADDDPFENTFSRQVGSASASTNVLVLPEMPMAGLTGPVPGTGEIIITGMIDVPKSISSTGSMSAVHESPDIDDLFEAGEREVPSTESTPVSAINAVSGHTATRAVMGGRKPRGNTVTTALVASTVVMAVAAVTVFVVAAANGLF